MGKQKLAGAVRLAEKIGQILVQNFETCDQLMKAGDEAIEKLAREASPCDHLIELQGQLMEVANMLEHHAANLRANAERLQEKIGPCITVYERTDVVVASSLVTAFKGMEAASGLTTTSACNHLPGQTSLSTVLEKKLAPLSRRLLEHLHPALVHMLLQESDPFILGRVIQKFRNKEQSVAEVQDTKGSTSAEPQQSPYQPWTMEGTGMWQKINQGAATQTRCVRFLNIYRRICEDLGSEVSTARPPGDQSVYKSKVMELKSRFGNRLPGNMKEQHMTYAIMINLLSIGSEEERPYVRDNLRGFLKTKKPTAAQWRVLFSCAGRSSERSWKVSSRRLQRKRRGHLKPPGRIKI